MNRRDDGPNKKLRSYSLPGPQLNKAKRERKTADPSLARSEKERRAASRLTRKQRRGILVALKLEEANAQPAWFHGKLTGHPIRTLGVMMNASRILAARAASYVKSKTPALAR